MGNKFIGVFCFLFFFFFCTGTKDSIGINLADHFSPVYLSKLDSLNMYPFSDWSNFQLKMDKISRTKAYQMTYVGVPLVVSGLIVKSESKHFQNLRNDYIPSFRHHYDDYIQYAPAVVMLGLKAAGVKSRSSWGRMIVSDAFTVALMASTVGIMKRTTNVTRPDGSTRNSFPSGHTATAFMAATMMHKEYGMTRSPWYSIGAYTVATVTAVSRQLNNRHWMSDILVGAGIGILATEIGYYFADLIFKDRGIQLPYLPESSYERLKNPSFLGLYVGFQLVPGRVDVAPDIRLNTATGSCAGFEGAWFMNRFLGIGGRFLISGNPVTLDQAAYLAHHPEMAGKFYDFTYKSMKTLRMSAGLYLSYPMSPRWLLGSKVLLGCDSWDRNKLEAFRVPKNNTPVVYESIMTVDKSICPAFGTGVSLTYVVRRNLGVRFFCDYNLSPIQYKYKRPESPAVAVGETIHSFVLGASANILFWK